MVYVILRNIIDRRHSERRPQGATGGCVEHRACHRPIARPMRRMRTHARAIPEERVGVAATRRGDSRRDSQACGSRPRRPPRPTPHRRVVPYPASVRRLSALSFPIGKQMPTYDFKRLSCTQSKSTTKPMTRKVDAHTRDERARDGVSRDEMRGVEWAAEGAPNGLRAQGPMMTPVGCDVRHTSRARVCWHLTRVRSRGTRCHPHLRSARAWPANQGGTASLTVGPSLMH